MSNMPQYFTELFEFVKDLAEGGDGYDSLDAGIQRDARELIERIQKEVN